ncbi:sugar phosphate isomerase/epimerase family protein [Flavimaricola marinus]|uniref:Xylose isomerase-like TIM barrel n=1 Tax=Flavimaricola marinus TaxID=1819565 RepID=A0A238LMM0_9RHOB|nr:sugar phosphate isomerase/epimerase family protein [Flavimaricola marinus]SMY10176.1 Xylose isomerase-like TIM barrel [Flavimaricola marinus]
MIITAVTNEVYPDATPDGLPKIFGRAKSAGVSSFEMRIVEGKRFPMFDPEAWERLKANSKEFGISYTAVSPGLLKAPLRSELMQLHSDHLLPMSLDLAEAIGVKTLILFGPTRAVPEMPGEFEEVVALISKAVDQAVARGFTVQLENLPGSWADTSDACLALLEAVNKPEFGYVWDTGNLYEAEQQHFKAGYEKLKPYIRNVHLKDGGFVDGKMVWMRYGEGVTDVKGQVETLIADGYEGTLVLEAACQPHELDDFPTSMAYLKSILE